MLFNADPHRRRSSVSESGLLSLSGSFLDATSPEKVGTVDLNVTVPTPQDLKTMSPRHQVFMELLHTEMNYVEILETIVEVRKLFFKFCAVVGKQMLCFYRFLKNHLKILIKLVGLSSTRQRLKSYSVTYRPSTKSISNYFCN